MSGVQKPNVPGPLLIPESCVLKVRRKVESACQLAPEQASLSPQGKQFHITTLTAPGTLDGLSWHLIFVRKGRSASTAGAGLRPRSAPTRDNSSASDPPVNTSDSPAPVSVRYAPPRPSSPPPPQSDVFCDICLKNQHLYKENLALYLPEPNDLRYDEFLASLPTYKAKLEDRYPQVCADCAPRARERIRQAGYVAKTDHLRRMMAGTRAGTLPLREGTWWRLWLIRFGGLGWWSSAVAQVAWHVSGAIMQNQAGRPRAVDARGFQVAGCARQAWTTHEVSYACVTGGAAFMPVFLAIAFITIWWNPQISNKYLGRRKGRMVKLADYFVHCAVALVFRAAAWWLLRDWRTYELTDDQYKGAHLFMIVFIVVATISGYTTVKLDSNPIVSFHIPDDQILPNIPGRDPNEPPRAPSLRSKQQSLFQAASNPTATQQRQTRSQALHQSSSSLAQQRASFQPQATSSRKTTTNLFSPSPVAATPAREATPDPDAMDWTPSHTANTLAAANLRQRVPTQQVSDFSIGPSPFQSRIPAAPPNRMRHPNEKEPVTAAQPFQAASEDQKRNFFREMTESREQKMQRLTQQQRQWDGSEASTVPTMFDDDGEEEEMELGGLNVGNGTAAGRKLTKAGGKGSAGDFQLAPQRLFLQSDVRDTGLENMFDEVFSFRDEADAGADVSANQQQNRGSSIFGFDAVREDVVRGGSSRSAPGGGLWTVVLFGLIPAVILGAVAVGVKMWRTKGPLQEP
ncbi:hypothetical protein FH972_026292 [Carpinus fangiana]|uniref:Ima1 N-terminal domain-containing protein n=1 Tax=Carpinus fangiana TaxID=176857 RepID=A0A5N6L3J6_9ROSI|nr:hypothetical protein FH972_026292 [Carpinus fangiana]